MLRFEGCQRPQAPSVTATPCHPFLSACIRHWRRRNERPQREAYRIRFLFKSASLMRISSLYQKASSGRKLSAQPTEGALGRRRRFVRYPPFFLLLNKISPMLHKRSCPTAAPFVIYPFTAWKSHRRWFSRRPPGHTYPPASYPWGRGSGSRRRRCSRPGRPCPR